MEGSARKWQGYEIVEKKLLKNAIFVRSLVLFGIIVFDKIIPDYDTSTRVIEQTIPITSAFDGFIRYSLSCFSHWDAVYFTDIALSKGYQFEQFHAFFPLLPILINITNAILRNSISVYSFK